MASLVLRPSCRSSDERFLVVGANLKELPGPCRLTAPLARHRTQFDIPIIIDEGAESDEAWQGYLVLVHWALSRKLPQKLPKSYMFSSSERFWTLSHPSAIHCACIASRSLSGNLLKIWVAHVGHLYVIAPLVGFGPDDR